jgi:hypothetical protein
MSGKAEHGRIGTSTDCAGAGSINRRNILQAQKAAPAAPPAPRASSHRSPCVDEATGARHAFTISVRYFGSSASISLPFSACSSLVG